MEVFAKIKTSFWMYLQRSKQYLGVSAQKCLGTPGLRLHIGYSKAHLITVGIAFFYAKLYYMAHHFIQQRLSPSNFLIIKNDGYMHFIVADRDGL